MSNNKSERRKHPRSKRGFRQESAAASDGLINHVDNISCSGVLCRTRRPVPVMTKMEILLELPKPENRTVAAEGIVIRCDPSAQSNAEFQIAILYTKLDEDDHHAIRRYVDHDLAHHAG